MFAFGCTEEVMTDAGTVPKVKGSYGGVFCDDAD